MDSMLDAAATAVVVIMVVTIALSLWNRLRSPIVIMIGMIVAFAAAEIMTGGDLHTIFFQLGAVTDNIRSGTDLWRLLTSLFVHTNVYHLIYNMIYLAIIGNALVNCVGSLKFSLIFFIGGMVTLFIVSMLFSGISIVGSSSAIAVVAGLTFVLPFTRTIIFDNMMNPRLIMRAIILIWVIGECVTIILSNNIDSITCMIHLVGISLGLVLGLSMGNSYSEKEGKRSETAIVDLNLLDSENPRLTPMMRNCKCPVCEEAVVVRGRNMVCRNGHPVYYANYKIAEHSRIRQKN